MTAMRQFNSLEDLHGVEQVGGWDYWSCSRAGTQGPG